MELPTKKDIKKNFDHYREIAKRFNEVSEKKKEKEQLTYAESVLKPYFDKYVTPKSPSKVFDKKCIKLIAFKETDSKVEHAFDYRGFESSVYIGYAEKSNAFGRDSLAKDCIIEVDRKKVYSRNGDGFVRIY
jgi:hypothetical protein